MHFLITHGLRDFGYNPGHTIEGLNQIKSLAPFLPKNIPLIVIGTGKRFMQIHDTLITNGLDANIEKKYSPFCGCPDGLEANGNIIIYGDKMILDEEYISLIRSPAFDAWKFIGSFPNNTLFCAGGELMIALGGKKINQKGYLYGLNTKTKTISPLTEGVTK